MSRRVVRCSARDEADARSIRDFSTATVSIRKLLDSDFDSAGNKRPVEDIDRLERGAAPAEVSENPGARRSSRRTGSSKPTKHETTPLDIDKLDTVKELKLKIHKIYDVPTIYQHLWHGDRALDDSSETVAAIGILPGDVIECVQRGITLFDAVAELRVNDGPGSLPC